MIRTCCLAGFFLVSIHAFGAENVARNPSFEEDRDGDGTPDDWRSSGDQRLVEQTLTIDKGRDGRRCARLRCTRYQAGNPAAHAMLCQMDVPVRRGAGYRVSFWARAEGLAGQVVSVALSDTSVWANCGLEAAFLPAEQWAHQEFVFRATRDCPKRSRLQIWFHTTGTLWLDDVSFTEAGDELYRPGRVIPAQGVTNLIPNASFECAADGWGSAEWDRTAHWGGPMNQLFGEIDRAEAVHGRASLRVALAPDHQPVSFFDYYELHRAPIRAPLVGNEGYLEVTPGRRYTLSVFMKAAADDTPALLAVRQFQGGSLDKSVRVSRRWERYTLPFTPRTRWCFVLAGPDLRARPGSPPPPQQATVWLDAFQLEQADSATEFQVRSPLEIGVTTDKVGNVFDWNEPLVVQLAVNGDRPERLKEARIDLRLTDFYDRAVWQTTARGDDEPARRITLPPAEQRRGFLRLHARAVCGDTTCERTIRLAVIPVHRGGDSRFGVNHAYPWPHLLDLCRHAGLTWVRDWSLKWQDVEPERGRFTFAEADHQIDRPLAHGLRVLGLLPFPSSNWSSSAPASVAAGDRYPQNRQRAAYAPRDKAEFENYVARTVAHYRKRIHWWQVFNEPLFTDYSLPRRHGYTGTSYAEWTKAFAQAVRRTDPQARVLAGIGYLGEGQIMEDFTQFFAAGGLQAADAVDIHHYPRMQPPEFIAQPLAKLNALMEQHGGRKPIWLTEYGYYADDDPSSVPMPSHGFDQPLASEQQQSEYAVRWAVLMLAGGVDKVFYHAGTCDGLNQDSLQGIFYEYAGQPHRIYAAQAVMAHWLTPACQFVKRLPGSGRAYLFREGRQLVCVIWAAPGDRPAEVRLTNAALQAYDLMGRPRSERAFIPSGTPVYVRAEGLTDDQFAAGLQ
jgi:hypothetical protein